MNQEDWTVKLIIPSILKYRKKFYAYFFKLKNVKLLIHIIIEYPEYIRSSRIKRITQSSNSPTTSSVYIKHYY